MKIIDAHTHIGNGMKMQLDVDTLLKLMDEAGIEFAIICPMDRYLAVANHEGNEFIIKAVRSHPDRLGGMAVANPWFGNEAKNELRRALQEGLSGLKIHPVFQGFRLGDHIIDPLLEIATEFDVPVYAHTGTAGIAEPFHLIELARRFPAINFLMGHAGASDYYNDTVRALEFVDNVWIETSRNGPANFCHWKINNLTNRIVFGSNAPEYIPAIELNNLRDIFIELEDQKSIFANAIQKVYKGRLSL